LPLSHNASDSPPTGPPVLDWWKLGFTTDHNVGAMPNGHFGVGLRNAGGDELQLSLFITAGSARFYVPRPRDLTLGPGA
jgi:hypothetical protein